MGNGVSRSIHRLIEAQAAARPEARAVVFAGEALSYAELDRRASRLARRLVRAGVGPEILVGVHLERSLDLVVSLLAVLKAGGAYLPLDPGYPAERRAFMLADGRAPVVIADGPLDIAFAGAVISPTEVDAGDTGDFTSCDVDPEHLAYIIYTSGSTGTPKGVLVPHGRVVRLLDATRPWFHFDHRDVWTCVHSHAFDFSVWEIWGALIHGGTVVVVSDAVRRSPEDLLDLLVAERVTVLNQVPSAFRHLAAAAIRSTARLALRTVIFGGEALELRSLAPWFARFPAAPVLVNMYGITETTVHVSYRPIDPGECATATGSPIGVPIPDLQLHLLDAALRPVADGHDGEVFVGGAGLARGYHARPGLTAQRFVPDPFSPVLGARLYRTGDLARRLADGSFDYRGRNDAQVKIRGFRIETGEIEAALAAHPGVRDAAVVVRDLGDDDRRLVAFVVLGAPLATAALRAWLADKLPDYMVPGAWQVLDALPITPSGKLDRGALHLPEVRVDGADHDAEPERILAALWGQLLGVAAIGREDRFFELGGDSLLAAQVASRLSRDHGVAIAARVFLTSPTLAEAGAALAEALARRSTAPVHADKLPRRPRVDRAPISFAQESIWVHDQVLREVAGRARGYVEGPVIRLRGPVAVPLLERALNELAARHEIWRTSFALDGDEPVQVIGRSARIAVRLIDRRMIEPPARPAELASIAEGLAEPAFALARAPLVRCALVAFADDDHALLLVTHHLVTDAWSEQLIAGELARLYGFLARGEPLPPRSEVETQYADHAAWERGPAHAATRDAARAYWVARLAQPPGPLALARTGAAGVRPIRLDRPLGAEMSARLAAFGRRHNVSPSAALYAAFAGVLAGYASDRFVLGVASANRTPATEQLPGCFSGVLPVIVELVDRPAFAVLARRLATDIAEAVPHGALALPEIARLAGGKLTVQVQVSTQLAPGVHTAGGVEFHPDYVPLNDAKFALELVIQERADRTFALGWVADPASWSVADVEQLAGAFDRLLASGLDEPARALDAIAELATPVPVAAALPVVTEAAESDDERAMTRLFAELLRVPRVAATDDFFELGGHSLLAIRLVAKIRAALGVELSLGQVFAAPTGAALAALVAQARGGAAPPELTAAPRDRPLVASSAQDRLWFTERMLAPDGPRPLNVSIAIGIRGALAADAIARALGELVARHEILRTRFRSIDRQLVQVIDPPFAVELPVVSAHPDTRDDRLRALAQAQARPAFDLAHGRLIRAQLVEFAPDDRVLLLAVHHIIYDGPSAGVIVRELAAVCEAEPLPPATQYADLAHWQRTAIAAETRAAQLAYWRGQLAGAPDLALPLDFARPPMFSHAGDRLELVVSPAIAAAARAFARREAVSLFATVFAGFAMVLARRTGQTDLVIGTTVTLRDRPELDAAIGPLLNLVALRVDVAGASFRTLVERVRDVLRDALVHRGVPFEDVVAALARTPDASRAPVFQAAVTFTQLPPAELRGARQWTLALPDPGAGVHEDLSLNLGDDGDVLRACFDYRTELFAPATIAELAAELEAVLAHGVAGVVTDDAPAHRWIEAQVDRTPDAIAVVHDGRPLRYRELDARANQLAHHLVAAGARVDAPIGVICDRSADLVVALLAIGKAGAAFLPLDPGQPRARLAAMIAAAGVRLVVGHHRWAHLVSGEAIWLDRDAAAITARPARRPMIAVDAGNLAYVVFTSGSTGQPKGVMVEHRGLTSYLAHCRRAYPLAGGTVLHSSIAVDLTLTSVFAPLIAGATIHVAADGAGVDGLVAAARAAGPLGFLKLTPSHLELLARAIAPGEASALASCLIVGGEQLVVRQLRFWRDHAPAMAIANEYGPTEAVVGCCVYVAGDPGDPDAAVPIGRAFAGNRLYVLDAARAPVAAGGDGELYIAGVQVARGYAGRPDLTAERFVPDPFGAAGARMYRTGDRVRVRRDGVLEFLGRVDQQIKIRGHRIEPGEVEHALAAQPGVRQCAVVARDGGAAGPQLIAYVVADALDVDALRAALADRLPEPMIPSAFVRVPAIPLTASGKLDRRALDAAPARADYTAAGYAAPRDPIEDALAGIWAAVLGVARVGVHDDFFALGGHSLLAAHVAARIEDAFGVALPLRTMFERVTVEALAAEFRPRIAPAAPPNSIDAAQIIAGVFAELLARPAVGLDDSFFALGGQVLATQQLIDRLHAAFGVELSLRAVLEAPTPRALAALLLGGPPPTPAPSPPPPTPATEPTATEPTDAPLAYAQQRLWFLHQLAPGDPAYHLPYARRLRGPLDREALRRALEAAVHRHDALRTTFPARDGVPRQAVQPASRFELARSDVSAAADRDAELARVIADEVDRPFALADAPPVRARLVRVADDDHVVVIVLHHIIADERSLELVWREVAAGLRGAPIATAPRSYAAYAADQRVRLPDEGLERQLAFWHQRLAGAPDHTDLPYRAGRPARSTAAPVELVIDLGAAVARQLRALGEGASLFMTCLAGLRAGLARATGQVDLCIGAPVSLRNRPALDEMIGLFVNMLALRARVEVDASFRALVRGERAAALEAYERQDAPFDLIVRRLGVTGSAASNPVFQVSYAHVVAEPAAPAGDAPYAPRRAAAQFDLELETWERGDSLELHVSYPPDLFEDWVIAGLADQLACVLRGVAHTPDAPIRRIALIDDAGRARALREARGPDEPRADADLASLFEAQADRTPDAIALVLGDARLSYRQLDARANQIAAALRGHAIGPEAVVGVAIERSFDQIAAILGVGKAGGAFVPLDPGLPAARLAYLVEASRPRAIVTAGAALPGLALPIIDARDPAIAALPTARVPRAARAGDALAYVLFTSGSTGRPKGVMVPHRAIANELACSSRALRPIGPGDALLQLAPLTFDQAVHEIWWPLVNGAALVLIDEGDQRDPAAVIDRIQRGQVSVLELVPTLLRALCATPGLAACASLRLVAAGGEPLAPALVRAWFAVRPDLPLINGYGPTETAVTVCNARCAPGAAVTIGAPWPNVQLHVLDDQLAPRPPGGDGELYIGGVQLARGYAGQPALTAERFVPDPFTPGARLYRTGDRARRRPDGTLELLGRLDDQIKLRGVRIELGELEAVLATHPDVAACAVRIVGGARGDELVAYVVPRRPIEPGALRDHLAGQLAEAMVPSAYVVLDELPRSASGKLDRRALPAPEASATVREPPRPPRSDAERALAEIWCEVLHVAEVGVHDDFFALGGHSLLAVQVAARIRARFAVALSLRQLFAARTLEALAREVEASDGEARDGEGRAHEDAPPAAPGALAELSFAQQRLWLVERLAPDRSAYHIPSGRRLRGAVDREALRRGFEDLIARHAILRTVFVDTGGAPRQRVDPPARWALPFVDLATAADPERALAQLSHDDAERAFDLATGPLIRAQLIRLADDDHVVLVTLHHIIADGWSIDVLWRELAARYAAHRRGDAPALAPLPLQYADHAMQQRAALADPVLAPHLAYWTQQLAGAPAEIALPRGPRSATGGPAEEVVVVLDPAATRAARGLARREAASLFMVVLAALRAVLARTTGQADLVIGTPVAHRDRRELEALIGLFVDTLALRLAVDPEATFAEAVRREREVVLAGHAHQDAPFERIVDALGVDRAARHTPVFQVWFVQESVGDDAAPLGLADRDAPYRRAVGTTKFDLAIYLAEQADGVELALVYDGALFDRRVIEGLGHRLVRAVALGAGEPDRRQRELAFAAPPHDPRIALARPSDPPVLAVIEQLATRQPDAPALRHAGGTWSRGALWQASTKIADALAAAGVVAGDRVALSGPPSPGLYAGFLAILRHGACFVPLSTRLPRDGAQRLLAVAGARLLLQVGPAAIAGIPIATIDPRDASIEMPAVIPARPGDPAIRYLYFTSGTTGAQKGVVGDLAPLAHFTAWQRATFADAGGVAAQLTELGFDVFLRDTMFALTSGMVMAVPPRPVAELTADELLRWLARERVTAIHTVPSLARAWLAGAPPDVALADLRCVFVVGEPLDAALVDRWRARFGAGAELINFYGTTETGPAKAWYRVPPAPDPGIQPIGRALPDTQLLLLRDGDQLSAAGEVGELAIRTPFSSRGYLDGSTGGFIANPFRADPADVIYRTGDLARHRPDGALELLGRVDDQVKLHGQRVDPPGIAAALRAHPAVTDAAVIAVRDGDDARLIAYVVRAQPAPPIDELREHLRRTVPPYMIPASFVALDALPRTASGKLDRARLPAADPEAALAGHTAPRSPEEEAIAAIWCEVLSRDRVGVRDDFFELGGHSLLAVLVTSRVRAALGCELSLPQFFAAPTVEGLAATVVRRRAGGDPAPSLPLVPVARTGELPLSFAQQRMWFLHRLAPDSPAYHVPLARRLRGPLAVEPLRRAFDQIVRRHEALRSVFSAEAGVPRQHILPATSWPLPVDDLAALAGDARDAALARITRDAADQPFDLATGPLLRTRLVRLADDDHVLLLTLHHIVSDGWSMGQLWTELAELYRAHATGAPPRLPALPIQYADFAHWQRASLTDAALAPQLAYWTSQLAGAPDTTALPRLGANPAGTGARGAVVERVFGAELVAGVRALCKQTGATPFVALLAAFRAVLARFTGQADLCIGTPIANRGRKEVEPLIGLMLNTLVLRTAVDGRASFAALVREERATALAAYAHQDVPFERVVDALAIERSLDTTPVFQVSFVHQNLPQPTPPIGDLVDQPVAHTEAPVRFDLSIVSFERDGELVVELVYRDERFARWQIDQLADRFASFLAAALRDPARPVARIPMLADDERARLLAAWNRTPGAIRDTTLPAMFEAQVDRAPDAIALVLGDARLTYRQLDARANQLAHALAGHGVGAEIVVGIALDRSFDLVAAILATVKAGGAWVPLDPQLPAPRLAYMASVARPAVVLTTRALAGQLPALGAAIVAVDELTAQPATRLGRALDPAQLAYVLFTSGSTGRPKGVMISHRGIVNELISAQALRAPLDAGDAFLQLAPYTFDLSVHEMLWPLSAGARVVLLPDGAHRDPRRILDEIRARGVTILHPVPTLLRALVADPGLTSCTSLRTVVCGGEPLPRDLVRDFAARRPELPLINSYGPTEASVTVSQWRARADAPAIAIGLPWLATQLHVLDDQLEPAPLGVAGELYLGGRQVGRGYAGQPGATAERFVPDPFGAPGARLYRTGDRARRWPDGNVELIGRIDGQVKLRGFRIELGEIEAVLRAHPGVRDAAVTIHGSGNDARLVGYIVGEAAIEAVRAALAARLPDYMVPRVIVRLAALPVNRSGKLDRAALPAPDEAALARGADDPPRPGLEDTLAGIWAELLGVGRIGRDDDFFDLGGHSLLAARLAWEAGVSIATVFAAPTIARLATAIEAEAAHRAAPPLVPVARGGALALSYAQQRMWFLHQLAPASTAYHIAIGRRLRGPLDAGALAGAFDDLIARHEGLRSVFPAPDGVPHQEIHPPAPAAIAQHDLSAATADDRAGQLARIADDTTQRPFDLARGPLIRIALVRLADDDHVLHIALHHIIADGWSVGVLWHELAARYAARAHGQPGALAPLAIQYADHAAWQRGWLTGDVLDAQLAYWKQQLAGAAEDTALPTRGPRPAVPSHRGARAALHLDRALADQLRALSRQHGCTLFITLLAAFRALLHRYTGQPDLCIGAPIANRGMRETEGVIGLFVNSLVLRTQTASAMPFTELLAGERTTALAAFAHGEAPFEMIVEALGVARSLSRNPVFQVMFQVQIADGDPVGGLPGLAAEPIDRARISTQVDLDVSALVDGDGIELTWVYATDLFERATIDGLARHFRALLAAIVADPETPIAELALLSSDERARLIHGWNATARAVAPLSLPERVDASAARTPDAIAIADRRGTLTYRALAARTDQLARHLRDLGLAREERVALWLDRDAELVIAMLGVVKAGGAYLPLDGELPADRLAFMAADAGVRFVITRPELRDRVPVAGAILVDVTAAPEVGGALVPPALAQLAYVLYTSGSTGRPKAVHVQHGSLVNFLASMQDAPGITARDSLLAVTTAAFDISGLELYLPLIAGARVVIAERDAARDAVRLQALLADATMMQATPATWRFLLDTGWQPRPGFVALCGGEAMPPELAAQLVPRVAALWNLYGPTETTIWSAHQRIVDGAAIRLGAPIANTQLHVLDPDSLAVQPLDVAGELFIAGDGLARGYGGQPGLTAERFLPDPFAAAPGARMYRTGDRVRRRGDGELEFLGRIDHQIKLRGFRVEPGEIEAVLAEHPRVAEVAVIVRDDRLVAYVVALGRPPADDELLAAARARLPDYMIPQAIVILDELPRSIAGKLDRKALPAPDRAARGPAPPRNELEDIVAGIWAELLGIAEPGIHDSFFALGGHSLLAVRALWAINRAFAIALPLDRLFLGPTIAELAAAIVAARGQPPAPPTRRARTGELPLSFAQQRMWFLHQLAPDSPAYHIATGLRLRGPLAVDALADALADTVQRHEALRTRFPASRGVPYQDILELARWPLPIDDLSALPAADRDAELARLSRDDARRPFDLAVDPPLRTRLVRLADDDHAVLATLHHIAADGWSLEPFWADVRAHYLARSRGDAPPAPLAIQYADYAAWQRDQLAGELRDRQLAYWTRQLADAPHDLALPGRGARPALQAFGAGLAVLELDRALVDQLRAIGRRASATLVMVLLAGLRALVYRTTGQADACIGVPTANRTTADVEPLIGLFVNTLVLRTAVAPGASFAELVGLERQTALAAYAHQDVPFEMVIDALGVPRAIDRNPLFQIMFQLWLDGDRAQPAWGDATAEVVERTRGATHLDLDVSAMLRDGGLELAFAYREDLFAPEAITRLAHQLRELLIAAAAAPDQPLDALPVAFGPITAATPAPPTPVLPAPGSLAARSPTEHALAAIWQQVLDVPRVGVRDNFFELGGHSLLAIRVLWEINRAFQATVPLTQLFAAPTIEQLAALPALAAGARPAADAVALVPSQRTTAAVTALQGVHYDIHRDDPGNPFVHMAHGLLLDGAIDRAALARALTELVRRHAILRTRYAELDGVPTQRVVPADQLAPTALEILDVPAPDHQRTAIAALRARPYDLTRDPPVRAALVVHGPTRHLLVLVIHHTCGDGASLPVIVDELVALYRHHTEADHPAPAAPDVQFIDYVDYVERFTASPAGVAQRAYWAARLAGAPAVRLPIDHDRGEVDRRRDAAPRGMACFATHSVTAEVPAAVHGELLALARDTEATMMMILLAGFAATLRSFTGQDDLCVQSTLSQRSQRPLERMIGVVANSLILRLDLAGRPSFRALVRRTQATVAAAFEHGGVPVIDRAPHAIRRINFNFTHGPAGGGEPVLAELAPGLRAHDVPIPLDAAKTPIDLHLWLFDHGDGVALRLLGNASLFERDTCERVLRRFTELLARAARDPAGPLPEIA